MLSNKIVTILSSHHHPHQKLHSPCMLGCWEREVNRGGGIEVRKELRGMDSQEGINKRGSLLDGYFVSAKGCVKSERKVTAGLGRRGFNTGKGEKLSYRQASSNQSSCMSVA